LQPFHLLLAVVGGTFGSDNALHNCNTSLVELVAPVTVLLGPIVLDEIDARVGLGFFCVGCHVQASRFGM
jgi:hypothetical protein